MTTDASAFDIAFESFRFDPIGLRLWRGAQQVPLQAKPAAVLAFLATNAGRVISKQELLAAVWPGAVSPAVLKVAIRAVRLALDDTASEPRFVQTLGRSGYRFLATPLIRQIPSVASTSVVGRDAAFDRLRRRLTAARSGRRQLVLVTGEAGIGKTAVVDRFASSVAASGDVAIGRGQCMEIYGEGEAYMPILEALEDLCRGARGPQAIAALRQAAPTWVTQLPAWIAGDEIDALRKRAATATLERIQGEIVSALELLAKGGVVVLFIEDLHVSDPSTIEILRYFLDRGSSGHVMIVGTSRPTGLRDGEDPLASVKRRGATDKDVEQIELQLLEPCDVAAYLRIRLATDVVGDELADALHRYTEGNPLFLVSMVGYLLDRDLLQVRNGQWTLERSVDGAGIPENLRLVIKTVVARAGAEVEQLLRVAAVQGFTFDSAVLARAAGLDRVAVEEHLRRVEQYTHLVRLQGTVPLDSGEAAQRYRFAHVLCQNALYESLEAADRMRLSAAVATAIEELHGEGLARSELAHLFEASGQWRRAAESFLIASEDAARIYAHNEAARCAERALTALDNLAPSADRDSLELALEIARGLSLSVIHGYSAAPTATSMRRARRLCERIPESPQLHQALWGLVPYYLVAPEFHAAREIGQQLLAMAERSSDRRLEVAGQVGYGFASVHLGELERGHGHLERGLAAWEPERHAEYVALYGLDPGLYLLANTIRSLWLLGYPQKARRRMDEAVMAARERGDPRSLAFAIHIEVVYRFLSGDTALAIERANECNALCADYGIAQEAAWTAPYLGYMIAARGDVGDGVDIMRRGIATLREMKARNTFPHFLALYAEWLARCGETDNALRVISEALAITRETGDQCYLAEVHRIQGEVLLMAPRRTPAVVGEATACFERSRNLAREQGAVSWELRALLALARLHPGEHRNDPSGLADVLARFEVGADTADLRAARGLLSPSRG